MQLCTFYGTSYTRVNVDGNTWGLAPGNPTFDDLVRENEDLSAEFWTYASPWTHALEKGHWDNQSKCSTIRTHTAWDDATLRVALATNQPSSSGSLRAAAALAGLGEGGEADHESNDVVPGAPSESNDVVPGAPPATPEELATRVLAAVESMAADAAVGDPPPQLPMATTEAPESAELSEQHTQEGGQEVANQSELPADLRRLSGTRQGSRGEP